MKIFKYWKPILISLIILYGSVTSGNNLTKVSILQIKNMDKLVHLLFYLALSLSLIASLYKNKILYYKDQIVITLITVISYGLLMEVFQFYLTENRSAELLDALANSIGCIFGTLLFNYLKGSKIIKLL